MPAMTDTNTKTNWKLTLAYDGTDFHGWQVQPTPVPSQKPTIQGTLAEAIAHVSGEQVLPQGSGRTDSGVHAAAQVASFTLVAPIPAANLLRALNRALPPSIRILAAEQVSPDFHARHSAIGKIYRYQIFQGTICSPFLARYVTCCHWPLDLAAMQQAAALILGEHDFTSFAACDPDRTTRMQSPHQAPRSNARHIAVSEWSTDPNTRILTYTIQGNGFLHHMVRNLVGTFMEAGRGRISPTSITEILEAQDRRQAGPTAPAPGLCLMQVLY
jgi:tRNA pseudouridine38-40 synthase